MKRVPRPNVRKRRGRAARIQRRVSRRAWRRLHGRPPTVEEFLALAMPLMAKATCDLIRIYDEETERAFGKPTGTGRTFRMPLGLESRRI